MINFENRQVEHSNRKLLTVVDKSYDENGDLATLTVDVARCEGGVVKEGTELKAEVFNELVSKITLLKNMICKMLRNYFSINTTSGTLYQGDKGDALTYVLTLEQDLIVRLDADAISNYFTVTFNRTENVCRFIVEEKGGSHESFTGKNIL